MSSQIWLQKIFPLSSRWGGGGIKKVAQNDVKHYNTMETRWRVHMSGATLKKKKKGPNMYEAKSGVISNSLCRGGGSGHTHTNTQTSTRHGDQISRSAREFFLFSFTPGVTENEPF